MTASQSNDQLLGSNQLTEYLVDAGQRTTLFWDAMRRRGNQYLEHMARETPHVLDYDYELIVTCSPENMEQVHSIVAAVGEGIGGGVVAPPGGWTTSILYPGAFTKMFPASSNSRTLAIDQHSRETPSEWATSSG